jgi:HEAT repeat protein
MSAEESLEGEVNRFRAWADANPGRFGEWEEDYPNWSDLYRACDAFLATQPKDWSGRDISNLLYAVARDNESGYVVDEATPDQILVLSRAALDSAERDAKWQLAVRLGEHPDLPEAEAILRSFADDAAEYVRRRALMALADLGSPVTEDLAKRAWDTGEEYQRMGCLHALYTIGSPLLEDYLSLAEMDGRDYLREAAARIRNRETECRG